MRQSTLAFVGMLALTMVGCGSDDSESSVTTESAPQPPAKVFEKPMANQFPSTISSVPVLIQPTNGNQRAKQVQKGRQDPFAGLFAQTSLSVPVGGTTPGIVPQPSSPTVPRQTVAVGSGSSRPSRTSSNTTNRQQSNPGRSNTGQSSGRSTSSPASSGSSSSSPASSGQSSPAQSSPPQSIPLPPVTPGSNFPPVAPPPPQEPDLASNVAVTGVIQIGEEPQAIVQVPNEGTSRYVRVGQRLSNGQVLVKRIEMNEGSDPIVILEQYGIEVARVVGEKPATAQTGTSTDGSQAPQSPGVEGTETPGQTTTPSDGSTGTPGQTTTPGDGSTGIPAQITAPGDAGSVQPDGDAPSAPGDAGSAQPNSDTPAAPLDAGSAQPNSDTPAAPLDAGSVEPSNTTTTDSNSFPPLPENSPDTGAE